MRDHRALGFAKILIAAATAAALGGCFHVPARALQNGRGMGYTAQSMVIYGEHNPRATRTLSNMLQSSAFGWQASPKPFTLSQWEW
ncbi:MAG: hypothetical protein DMD26_04140 [Gemmatimonadetes bacterium]|nr:MAG: hypothetical protein DMD26_04140 [Gemmatimonadota bacterium]